MVGLGPTRTEESRARNLRLQNERRNPIRAIKEKMAGGRRQFYALPPERRKAIHDTAKHLHEQGRAFQREAERIESSVKEGFVYVIAHPSWPEYVKIGCALDVDSRLGSFQTGCPRRAYRVLHAEYAGDRRKSEAEVHQALALYRAEGEWFRVSPEVAISAVTDYCNIETVTQE